jgi:hypothetical protein
MTASRHARFVSEYHRWLVAIVVIGATLAPAAAQDHVRVDGTVLWIQGQTLTLATDLPSAPGYTIVGQYLLPVPGPRQTVNVDLRQLPQTDYAFMRSGERVSVTGVVSSDRRRLIATSIIRDAEPQAP